MTGSKTICRRVMEYEVRDKATVRWWSIDILCGLALDFTPSGYGKMLQDFKQWYNKNGISEV